MNTAEIIHNLAYYQNWYLFLWENHCFALTKAEWQEFIGLYLYFHVSSCSVCCKVSSLLTELLQNCWTFFEQKTLWCLYTVRAVCCGSCVHFFILYCCWLTAVILMFLWLCTVYVVRLLCITGQLQSQALCACVRTFVHLFAVT